MARAGLRMIGDRPLFGMGPEMVKPYYTLYRDADAPRWRVPHLHNNILQTAAASGVFAAAAYLAMLALFFARTIAGLRAKSRREPAVLFAAPFLAVTALTVAGLFEYNFGDTEVLIPTLLLLALPFSRSATSATDE
jgi:O-antigen ligase